MRRERFLRNNAVSGSRNSCSAGFYSLNQTVFHLRYCGIGAFPFEISEIILVFVHVLVGGSKFIGEIYYFVLVYGQNVESGAVPFAVFGEFDFAGGSGQLAYKDIGIKRIVVYGERKRSGKKLVVSDVFEIVGYFNSYFIVGSLLRINGDRVFSKRGIRIV